MVFNRVVGPTREHFGHLGPLVAVGCVGQEQNPLFVRHPFYFEYAGIEMIVPPFSALLPEPPLHELGDEGPPLWAILFNKFPDEVILLVSPRFFPEEFRFVVV